MVLYTMDDFGHIYKYRWLKTRTQCAFSNSLKIFVSYGNTLIDGRRSSQVIGFLCIMPTVRTPHGTNICILQVDVLGVRLNKFLQQSQLTTCYYIMQPDLFHRCSENRKNPKF